ncbi:MAG: T9SS type A sorting domain-containing protein [Saprospiraceae bacterium]|nr:T9SS type A sorting domain-containing protein [Saprospiraceae bacterium]
MNSLNINFYRELKNSSNSGFFQPARSMRFIWIVVMTFITNTYLTGQAFPFEMLLEPLHITGMQGIQSYAVGQHGGKWMLIGGRIDGLHRRQPFASFDQPGQNNQIIVVDPKEGKFWTASVEKLSPPLREQLKSTNMEFYQEAQNLILVGGYGFSDITGDHVTFPNLTVVDIPATIQAVIENRLTDQFFRQLRDTFFQITGGRLDKINNSYYLIGGQKFMGRYNPMGPTHGPGFVQEYTNCLKQFDLIDDSSQIRITNVNRWTDKTAFHRRDYNVVAQIMPDGREGLTAFSGVFQETADLPYLNSVDITEQKYEIVPGFAQYFNHYHCATIPLYSEKNNEMHTLFFGGIAQYYEKNGQLVQDNNVPFVKTIARITRSADGKMIEYKLPIELPEWLGASSELIQEANLPKFKNNVVKLDELNSDTTLLGYLVGGITSNAANIFWDNEGDLSTAMNTIFKVKLVKINTGSNDFKNEQSCNQLQLHILPNPNEGQFVLSYFLAEPSDIQITITTENGKLIHEKKLVNQNSGKHLYKSEFPQLKKPGVYFVKIKSKDVEATQKAIVSP